MMAFQHMKKVKCLCSLLYVRAQASVTLCDSARADALGQPSAPNTHGAQVAFAGISAYITWNRTDARTGREQSAA